MTKPLALIFYEKLLPGSQLINRLQDLGYRVQTVTDAALLQPQAEREKPIVVIVDLFTRRFDILSEVSRLRAQAATEHIPVLGFTHEKPGRLHQDAQAAGVTLVASEAGILEQLPHLLDQVLQLD